MQISFHKLKGVPSLGVLFFWSMRLDVDSPIAVTDILIPELYYDFFFVRQGTVRQVDSRQRVKTVLPQQTLKTIFTHRLTLEFSAPLVLFGARFALKFAELYWNKHLPSNSVLKADWTGNDVYSLATFAAQVTDTIAKRQVKKTEFPMVAPMLDESDWLAHYSPRHKRRLYKSVFGISRKEMLAVQSLHVFLGQTCDFTSQRPRIIEYIDSDVFYDQPHLNHAFKKMTGFSPLDYFQANSILQDNLMAASYNEHPEYYGKITS